MLRTNTKKYLLNMETFLTDAITGEGYNVNVKTSKQKFQFVLDCFFKEYDNEYARRRTPNYQERVGEWLSGLPSCIDIPFYNVDILALAKDLQEIDGETKKSWEDAVLKNYWNFMALHIIKLQQKYND